MGRLQATASVGDPLKLSEINTQFDATNQSLRAFLRNGTYVKSSDINSGSVGATVPTTGTIKMSDLLGKSEVYITNQSITGNSGGSGGSAYARYELTSSGLANYGYNGTFGSGNGTYSGEWLPGNKNSGDYEVYATFTEDDPVLFPGSPTGASLNTWLSLSTTRTWTLAVNGADKSGNLYISIRNASDGVVLDTASISMQAFSAL